MEAYGRRRLAALACTLAAALVLPSCQATPDTQAQTAPGAMPRDPRTELNEARFEAAIAGLDFATGRVVVVDSMRGRRARASAPQLYEQGMEAMAANERTGSLTLLTRAVRSDPTMVAAYNGLGDALRYKGKLDHAIAAYRTALDLDPGFAEARFNLAMALAAQNHRDEAIDEMLAYLELEPRSAEAHERLAIWYYYNEDHATAWQHAHAAQDLGRPLPPQFQNLLEARMPDPRS